jgi:hypothetical protein
MLLYVIPLAWGAVTIFVVAACRVASRADIWDPRPDATRDGSTPRRRRRAPKRLPTRRPSPRDALLDCESNDPSAGLAACRRRVYDQALS